MASPELARHIPDELIEDIFARMPARSVLRCRSLSRAWAAALSSDAFVDHHLRLANRRRNLKLCIPPKSAFAGTVSSWSPETTTTPCDVTPLMAVPHSTRNGRLIPYGRPCRGLLLLRAIRARLYFVCNPSAGEVTALPDGRMAGYPRPSEDYASVGLGYDARTRTHKAVRLLYHHGQPAGCDVYDIAGASSTGHWRPAATGVKPPGLVHMNKFAVYAQGHLHWMTMRGGYHQGEGDSDSTIISFSMADEEFGFVPPPRGTNVNALGVTELAGCLCVYSSCVTPTSPSLDIWLLTDQSTATWELRCRIVDVSKLVVATPEMSDLFVYKEVTPLILTDDGDGDHRVLFLSEDDQVAEYHAASGTLRHVGPPRQLVPYEESLVSVGRPYEDILFSSPSSQALALALRRLPARALGRLKLVCRSWRAMIETDRFAASHNAHVRETMAEAGCHVMLGSYSYLSLVFVSLDSCLSGQGYPKPPLMTTRTVVRKACHGLVLVTSVNGGTNIVHNPVTGTDRNFSFRSTRWYPPQIPEVDDGRGCAGLGYDASREEHVLVRLAYTGGEGSHGATGCIVQLWRLRDISPYKVTLWPPTPADVGVPPVHVAGKMYWMGEQSQRRLGSPRDILVFDVSTLAFDTMPAPPTLPDAGGTVLTALAGKLCVAHSCRETETMTIWAKSAEDEDEWETLHVIHLARWPAFSRKAAELVVPMAIDAIDGRVLLDAGKALGYYDAQSQTLETVCSCCGDDEFIVAAVCEDSLVRPYDRKCRIW